jgi:hypothetical protein
VIEEYEHRLGPSAIHGPVKVLDRKDQGINPFFAQLSNFPPH